MSNFIRKITNVYPTPLVFNASLLIFRIAICLQLMLVHGTKKIGIGIAEPEKVPNPYHLPEVINQYLAIAANLIFPVLVILGVFTRLAVIPILALTLTGYFVVHLHDSPSVKDIPFMYSLSYLLLLVLGPGRYSLDHLINKWS